ncbi:alpha/beta fold hydrolase [Streptomyces spinoverrucosus]|uniref:alpha/beta fold hydrolase n=1 Tax=Streptomyces spinoverrucosus TaxID=284043 RepID=UPI0018C36BBC|nr:alpha/beta fold hydrolase [Streptomyces spinoverrucosus]MBG0855889.1 alpha/beta fold hydrolase [Streptomyces spinoverrucosus]
MSSRGGAYDSNAYDIDGFRAAYDKVMAKWPHDREALEIRTPFGGTHVNACGPRDAPPLILLPGGGGATSASWFAQAADLARTRRLYAVDLIGRPGRSNPAGGRPLRTVADLTAWLDALLDGLGVETADLGGHSYGAWIAVHHAVHAPDRVRSLFLLDPTQCFAGFRAAYLLRALPMLLRPSARRVRAFLEWETGGAALDPDWLRLQEAAAGFPAARPVTGPRPAPEALRGLNVPVLLLVAASSRTHDTYEVASRAGALLPRVETAVLPEVSHHALPHAAPPELGRRLSGFLGC